MQNLLKSYKNFKSLGLDNKTAHIWAKQNENIKADAFMFDGHCGCNVLVVSNKIGVEPILLSRIVSASYQKTGSGESFLIEYLNGSMSHKDFFKWYNKNYQRLLVGIKAQKRWALKGIVSNSFQKKPNEPNWVYRYRRYSQYRRYCEFNDFEPKGLKYISTLPYYINKETGWR